jgi:hypothetical protein
MVLMAQQKKNLFRTFPLVTLHRLLVTLLVVSGHSLELLLLSFGQSLVPFGDELLSRKMLDSLMM